MPVLGNLEVAVMEALWGTPKQSAKDLHQQMGSGRGISLNTIQSTLERLHRKQLLARQKSGHAFFYSPRVCRQKLVAAYLQDALGRFGADPVASIAAFVETVEGIDDEALDQLETALARLRQQQGAS